MQILVNVFIFIFGGINIFIDFGLLYSIFISRTLPKLETLTLFYFRLFIDGIVGIGAYLVTIVDVSNSINLWISPIVTFFLYQPVVHVTTIRSFLVVVITIDRIFAIYCPISYRAYRPRIPNLVSISLACVSSILDDVVLLTMCSFDWSIPSDCKAYTCLVNQCFLQYLVSKEMVEHSIIVIGSLAIAVKLFLFKKGTRNRALEKATQLALIDATVIFIFYAIPLFLILVIPVFATIIDIIMPLTKVSGYAFDGYLVYKVLKRRSDTKSNSKAKTSSRVLFQVPQRLHQSRLNMKESASRS